MGIRIEDIIKDLSKSVNAAYQHLSKQKVAVHIPEVEISLNLEVELEGESEKPQTTQITKKEKVTTKNEVTKRYIMDEKTFKEKGITFRRIGTVHNQTTERTNFTLRIVFIPSEEK